jgi:hypothetical protein
MTTKIFSIIVGLAALLGIGFIAAAQSLCQSFVAFGKKPVVVGVITALLTAGAVYLATTFIGDSFILFWVMAFIFLAFGIIHMGFAHRKFIYQEEIERTKVISAEFLFATAVMLVAAVLFSALQYFIINKNFLFYPLLLTALLFIIPFMLHYSFEAAFKIPKPIYKNWIYPVDNPIDPPEDNASEKLLVIGFEIPKKLTDVNKTYFRAKTPESINLGELFYHFINDYNELQSETKVQILDDKKVPLVWYFRLKTKWFQRNKVLDPNITIRENKVKENSVIICEHFVQSDE